MGSKSVGKSLVLGAVRGFRYEQMRPFLVSLEKTGYQGDVCFLYDDLSEETLACLRGHKVLLRPFKKFVFRDPFTGRTFSGDGRLAVIVRALGNMLALNPFGTRAGLRWYGEKFFTVHCSRYLLFHQYLASLPPDVYTNVLLADTRDVVFQRDPFDFHFGDELCVSNEPAGVTLDSCADNREWIEGAFGTADLNRLKAGRLSCSGVTIGSFSKVLHYLEMMSETLTTRSRHVAIFTCYDQGTHNYLLLNDKLRAVRRLENGMSPVLTMGAMKPDEISFNDSGRIVNQDGSVINLLHQYDRHPAIASKLIGGLT